MKLLDKISNGYKSLFRRRRVSVTNPANNHEEWFTHISPVGLFSIVISTVIFIFVVILVLSGYTPLLNIFPEYKTESERSREALIESIIKIDSIERSISNMAAFNANISLIMDGNSPISYNAISQDSSKANTGALPPNNLEALLREEMKRSQRYNLSYQVQSGVESKLNTISYTSPIEGIVTEHYDLSKSLFGTQITAQADASIFAVDSGTVISSLWSPDFGYIIEIIHPKGDISIYKNISQSLVEKGQRVERGEVIGYNTQSTNNIAEAKPFEFELWIDGKPVNPELYINF